jgi:hypothetical protein
LLTTVELRRRVGLLINEVLELSSWDDHVWWQLYVRRFEASEYEENDTSRVKQW